jgi:uncharacterized protein (TIGR03083 family)
MSTTRAGRPGTPQRSGPWVSAFDRDTAMRLAATEYERLADLLVELGPDDWRQPTECTGWDVRAMAGHCVGMAQMVTGLRETARQTVISTRAAKRSGKPQVDELTALQVREQARVPDEMIAALMRKTGRAAVAGRARMPGLLRRLSIPQDGGGETEKWRLGFLTDTILTRDPWMHRGDISRATGRELKLTAEHDGLIVADVVAEWSIRHGQPFELVLTGAAGGRWQVGEAGARLALDAVEFCRALSGRGDAAHSGLLATAVPF